MPAWRGCRVLEVSALLRELVLQMDIGMDGGDAPGDELLARERRLGELALDELRRAAPVRLGIELPQDKRLRALCEAVLADPSRHATLDGWARNRPPARAPWRGCSASSWARRFGPWRQQVLLARALTLAAQGRPMGLIATELGYASPSAFSAMVRRAVGQPPSRFFAARLTTMPTPAERRPSMDTVLYDFTRQDASGASCTAHAWAKVPAPLSPPQRDDAKARAAALLKAHDAVLVAHYYVDGDLQDLALETGGMRRRFAGDGALRPRPCGADAGRRRRALHGRERQDPVAATSAC